MTHDGTQLIKYNHLDYSLWNDKGTLKAKSVLFKVDIYHWLDKMWHKRRICLQFLN